MNEFIVVMATIKGGIYDDDDYAVFTFESALSNKPKLE